METAEYRVKYAKRPHGKNMAYPPGGRDVIRLCDCVDALILLVREMQIDLPTDRQNDVERKLWIYGGEM